MSHQHPPTPEPSQPRVYQIRIKGQLGQHWSDWFGGLVVTLDGDGDTLLTGPVADQAALYGVLRSIRDLGIPLLGVVCLPPDQSAG